jgi:predicted Fe-Mo cluster-binding NifX family protein
MPGWLKQSTAVDVTIGPFLDATDGVTAETALTLTQPDIRLSKNGGAYAQKSAAQTLSHQENGNYQCNLSTTDTGTVGLLRLVVFESGAAPVWEDYIVLPANVYDALFGTDLLQVDISQYGNVAGAFSGGRPEVNTSHWAGTAVASAVILAAANIASDAITAVKIAAGAFTSTKFASGAFDAVWTVAARILTAGTNIVLAKGTGVTGFNDLDAAGIRTALGLASANVDTQLAALSSNDTTINNNVLTVAARLIALAVKTGTVVADGSNSTTTFKTDLTESSNEHWKESFILITSGTLTGAARKIDGFNATTDFVTVNPAFPSTPATGVTFAIINR